MGMRPRPEWKRQMVAKRWTRIFPALLMLSASHAWGGPVSGEASYCPVPPPGLDSVSRPGDSLPETPAATCGTPAGRSSGLLTGTPWSPSGAAHVWRPRHRHLALARPRAQAGPTCEASPREIRLASGPSTIDVITAGARPNSSVTLRIDNRTTVTITVNQAQDPLCPVSGSIVDSGSGDRGQLNSDALSAGFPQVLTASPSFAGSSTDSSQGSSGGEAARGGPGTAAAILEPSSLLLLGGGIAGWRVLSRRRRRSERNAGEVPAGSDRL